MTGAVDTRVSEQDAFIPDDFVERCVEALTQIIEDSKSSGTCARFLRAFDHRASYPWLDEHSTSDTAGRPKIARGIASALAMYSVPTSRTHYTQSAELPLDDAARADLRRAVDGLLDLPTELRSFAYALRYGGLDIEKLGKRQYVGHVRHALEFYGTLADRVETSDPW